VLVGFGTDRIAIIDPSKPKWLSNIPLPAHPEGFAISPTVPPAVECLET
jgi:hypothetical protein